MERKLLDIEARYEEFKELNKRSKLSEKEFYRLHILNEKNKKITEKVLNDIFKKYGLKHKVKHLWRFQKAMIDNSYLESTIMDYSYLRRVRDCPRIKDPSKAIPLITLDFYMDYKDFAKECKKNPYLKDTDFSYETLEFRGDAVLHNVLTDYLVKRYPSKREGFLSDIRSCLEDKRILPKFLKALKLQEYIIIPRYMEVADARIRNKDVMENVFEAFLGALIYEISFDQMYVFIINIIEREADITKYIHHNRNYRGRLKAYTDIKKWDLPEVVPVTDEKEISILANGLNEKRFYYKVTCGSADNEFVGYGKGKSKQNAQAMAAKAVLHKLGILYDTSNNAGEESEFSDIDNDSDIDGNESGSDSDEVYSNISD